MNIKKGICSIATVSVMLILAVALSVTTKLVQQKQGNRVDAAAPIVNISSTNQTVENGYYKYQLLDGDVSGDNEGVPDGKIDSRDYSYAKERGTEAQTSLVEKILTKNNNQKY